MIALLSLAALAFVLLLNVTGLTLIGRRLFQDYGLAKVASPVLLCLALFCVEHFVGLGDIAWLGVLTTAAAIGAIYRGRDAVRQNWWIEAAFAVGFFYVFAWRVAFPDLNGGSEKLTDLTFILDYMNGSRLPPPDHWLPPYRLDVYYGLQYYSAGLAGRLLGLDAGTAYNLSLALLGGLTITAAALTVHLLGGGKRRAQLATAAFVLGSTGGALFVPLMAPNSPTQLSDGVRFLGGFSVPSKMTTEFGRWLLAVTRVGPDTPELPAETFGYLLYLGDHHPPMSGFLLLALALYCIALAEAGREIRIAATVLAATVPVIAVANSWNLPLQGALVVAWIVWRLASGRLVPWRALGVGAAAGLVLSYPFLLHFGLRSLDYGVKLKLVQGAAHTPPVLGLIVFGPFLLLVLVTLGEVRRGRTQLVWPLFWLALLAVSEFVFIDDIYGGRFDRFNTTLKWWPWIMAGILLTLGPLALNSVTFLRRVTAVVALTLLIVFAIPLARQFVTAGKPHLGQLDGAGWIRDDVAEKPILEFLKMQPHAAVLQRTETDAFTTAPSLTIHAGQPAFLGWPAHEKLWRGNRSDIEQRSDQVKKFYRGELTESKAWLLENDIEHVLWLKSESQMPAGAFDRIQSAIGAAYIWREYYRAGDFRVGVWSRRKFSRVPVVSGFDSDGLPQRSEREAARPTVDSGGTAQTHGVGK